MAVFFTSDTHFGHTNVIKYSNRPFASADEMDQAMISNWNARIKPKDIVYHLGDFCFMAQEAGQRILDSLNGTKHLIVGNHDRVGVKLSGWETISPLKEININGTNIVLCHYAMRVWNKSHYGAFHLYGHSHGSLPDDPNSKSMDVGVDCHGYAPLSMSEIHHTLSAKPHLGVDHHG